MACCKNQGVPFKCTGYCSTNQLGCVKWSDQIYECREGNKGKVCCEKQGVPDECSAYCETAWSLEQHHEKSTEIKKIIEKFLETWRNIVLSKTLYWKMISSIGKNIEIQLECD